MTCRLWARYRAHAGMDGCGVGPPTVSCTAAAHPRTTALRCARASSTGSASGSPRRCPRPRAGTLVGDGPGVSALSSSGARTMMVVSASWARDAHRWHTVPVRCAGPHRPHDDVMRHPPVCCARGAPDTRGGASGSAGSAGIATVGRSEEHTSELQSREKLVCRLLLEKKKLKLNSTVSFGWRKLHFPSLEA